MIWIADQFTPRSTLHAPRATRRAKKKPPVKGRLSLRSLCCSVQCIEHARANFVDAAEPRNAPVLRRMQRSGRIAELRPVVVVVDQRLRLRGVHVEALG